MLVKCIPERALLHISGDVVVLVARLTERMDLYTSILRLGPSVQTAAFRTQAAACDGKWPLEDVGCGESYLHVSIKFFVC